MATGMKAAKKAAERKKSGFSGNRLVNFYWTDDDENREKVLRFLTDDVITASWYEYVVGGKPDKEGKQYSRDFIAPGSIAHDRRQADGDPDDGPFTGELIYPELEGERDFFLENNIWLPDFKKKPRPPAKSQTEKVAGLAVLRDVVPENVNGRRRNIPKDKLVKRVWTDKEGEEHEEEGFQFGIVRQGVKNFWTQLFGWFEEYGTICDRDYRIVRSGDRLDTTYSIRPLDPDPDLLDPEQLAERYSPPIDLREWAVERAKYETADRWVNWENYQDADDEGEAPPADAKVNGASSGSKAKGKARRDDDEDRPPVQTPGDSANDELQNELAQYRR